MRIVAAALFLLLLIAWQLPASLIDTTLNRTTENKLRLTQTQGSVWHGSGFVMVLDPLTDHWQPWTKVDWKFDWGAVAHLAMAWQLNVQDSSLARVEITASGFRLDDLHLRGPARMFLQQIPNALGRAGWRGDIALDAEHWRCDWDYQCVGGADLRWLGAASDLLVGRVFGDYQVLLVGNGETIDFQWDTLQGTVQTKGEGRWRAPDSPRLAGTIRGDMLLLQSLPAIASRWVRAGSEPGLWHISM